MVGRETCTGGRSAEPVVARLCISTHGTGIGHPSIVWSKAVAARIVGIIRRVHVAGQNDSRCAAGVDDHLLYHLHIEFRTI